MDAQSLEAVLNGPAMAPPSGEVRNMTDPPRYEVVSYLVTTIAIVVTTLAVWSRMYTRAFITKQVGYADYFVLIAWALFAAFIALVYLIAESNPGINTWNISIRDLRTFLYWYQTGAVLYGLTICFTKLSILSQYITIFMPTRKPAGLYWLTVFIMVANVISYIIFSFLEIFACNPRRKSWDPLVKEGHCIQIKALNTGATSINTGSDFIILVIPQLVIWRLNMAWKNKVAVSLVFLVAILAIISSTIRLYYCVILERTEDVAFYSWLAGIWTLPEIMFGIVVACLPAFRPFLRKISQSKMYVSVSSFFKTGPNSQSTHPGSGYKLDERSNGWPPNSDNSAKSWAKASKASQRSERENDSSSTRGLYVNTSITVEEERRI